VRERDLKSLEFDKVLALVAGFAASEPAREEIAALRPATDPAEVRERLRASAEMAELRRHAGSIPISEFSDIRGLILAAAREGAVLDGESLVKIRDFVLNSRHLSSFIRSRVEPFPRVAVWSGNLLAPKELADALLKALADDGGLLDDASPELKRLRNRLRTERLELETRLLRSLNQPGMESFVSDYLVTVRNRRFVLPLKLNYSEKLEGIVQDRSVSGETLFVEPMWAVELNNRVMMLESDCQIEEHRILTRLSAMVRGYSAELRMTFDAMVALDVLNARAIFAERFSCSEPEISDAGIELNEARHPLLTANIREVVPIDISIGPQQKGLVISGPNTGGKTVALKTLGLLSMMAQTGILIPAREPSRVAVFRSIFADIGDEQSIEASLSTFSAHIANLSEIVRSLDEPALVILDEPGAGTDPAEGAALAIGLVEHLAARRCVVAVATHSTAVKLHAYSRPDFGVAAVDFDVERLAPLYKLRPGTIGQSYGLAVARRLGLPAQIIEGAEKAMGREAIDLSRALERLDAERARLADAADKAASREAELAISQREATQTLDREKERLRTERQRLREEGVGLVRELRREGDELMKEVRAQAKSRRDVGAFVSGAMERIERAAPAAEAREEAGVEERPLVAGDEVELGGIRGQLISIEPGRAVVARGGLRIEVAPDRIRRAKTAAKQPGRREPMPAVSVSTEAGEREECNLIGMRASDALRKLEEFLDQAYLTNQREVRVVHGIGSGALRKAVAEYLATSPYCSSFHEAEPRHGGAGATIVELNQ